MGQSQNIWDMVKTYGTKSKCDGTKSNRMGQSVVIFLIILI